MLFDGIPILYQGQEQHYSGANVPANRETIWTSAYSKTAPLYTYIAQLNLIRKYVIVRDSTWLTYKATPVYSDNSTVAIRKGNTGKQLISLFTNRGSGGCGSVSLTSSATGFTSNMLITELLTCNIMKTDSKGNLAVTIKDGLPNIFYPTLSLPLGFICIPNLCKCYTQHIV
jgi:alpha-amylase